MRESDQRELARQEFIRQSKKVRRLQIFLLPLFAALLIPLSGFLWFAFVPELEQARPPLSPATQAPSLIIRGGGDIMLAGMMADKISDYGPDFPFRKISEFLGEADFSYGVLETAIADQGSPLPGKEITLRAPPETIESLLSSNLSLVALASNHMMDYDTPALMQTIELLAEAGLSHMGAGEDDAAAAKPYTLSKNGLRIAFLNFCENADIFYSYQYQRVLAAGENRAGIAALREQEVLAAISEARRNHDAVVLTLHWGEEFSYLPGEAQRGLAQRLIDGGADVIIGSHPHSLQGAEIYNNGLILYSLGNLLYGQTSSRQAREAIIAELEFTSLGWQRARLYPLLLSEEGQPALATGQDAAEIRERLRSISAGFGANFSLEGEALVISK